MAQQKTARRTFGPAGLRRRGELMDAAVVLAARQGFSRTRVSDIVGRVGVGQGVFYWYFESKEALFREILADTTRRMRIYQAGFIRSEPDPVRRIAKGILGSFEFVVQNRYAFALIDHATAQSRLRRERSEAGRVHRTDTTRHIEEAMNRGAIRKMDPAYPARAINGVVDRLARDYLGSGGATLEGVDEVAQAAIDFCLGGLLGDRMIDVSDLRREIEVTPELLHIRDTVGSGGVSPDGS